MPERPEGAAVAQGTVEAEARAPMPVRATSSADHSCVPRCLGRRISACLRTYARHVESPPPHDETLRAIYYCRSYSLGYPPCMQSPLGPATRAWLVACSLLTWLTACRSTTDYADSSSSCGPEATLALYAGVHPDGTT